MNDIRFDVLVCEHLGVSREYAKELILGGKCMVAGKIIIKPGAKFPSDTEIVINAEKNPYVSRGGLKLAKALDAFQINLNGLLCLDIGASTGGFTDCMLAHGAKKVIALDNGRNQLNPALVEDCRVILEEKDIRHTTLQDLPWQPQFITCDVSFISLEKIIPSVSLLLKSGTDAVFLLKPQFECGVKELNKKGVVKSTKAHVYAINHILKCLLDNKLLILGITFSPITGQGGNIEYLIYARKTHEIVGSAIHTLSMSKEEKNAANRSNRSAFFSSRMKWKEYQSIDINETVRTAHESLRGSK